MSMSKDGAIPLDGMVPDVEVACGHSEHTCIVGGLDIFCTFKGTVVKDVKMAAPILVVFNGSSFTPSRSLAGITVVLV